MSDKEPKGLAQFDAFLDKIKEQIVDPIIYLIGLAAFILFAVGLVQFILGAGDEEKRRTGRQHMLWGIIGLVIVFGAGIIVKILGNIVGTDVDKLR